MAESGEDISLREVYTKLSEQIGTLSGQINSLESRVTAMEFRFSAQNVAPGQFAPNSYPSRADVFEKNPTTYPGYNLINDI